MKQNIDREEAHSRRLVESESVGVLHLATGVWAIKQRGVGEAHGMPEQVSIRRQPERSIGVDGSATINIAE